MIQSTSLEAFRVLEPNLGHHQETVLTVINSHPDMCNKEIASFLMWSINCVTPRVKELRDKGLVYHSCNKTFEGRRVMCWRKVC